VDRHARRHHFLFGAVWFGPAVEATLTLVLGRSWGWGDALTRGVSFGASMAIGLPLVWWLSDSNGERRDLRRSIADDALPVGADPGEWWSRLRSELSRLKVARWLLAGVFGVEAALLAAVAVTTGEGYWDLWLAAGVAAVCAAVSPLWGGRSRDVIERLRDQLPHP
jgi:hypothetical protein